MMVLTAIAMMVLVVMTELTMQQRLGARGAAHALEKVRTTEDLVAGHLILTRWRPSHEKTITSDPSSDSELMWRCETFVHLWSGQRRPISPFPHSGHSQLFQPTKLEQQL